MQLQYCQETSGPNYIFEHLFCFLIYFVFFPQLFTVVAVIGFTIPFFCVLPIQMSI